MRGYQPVKGKPDCLRSDAVFGYVAVNCIAPSSPEDSRSRPAAITLAGAGSLDYVLYANRPIISLGPYRDNFTTLPLSGPLSAMRTFRASSSLRNGLSTSRSSPRAARVRSSA